MAASGFLVICPTEVPLQAFAQFALSFIPLKPPPLLLASADPEAVRLISAFAALIGREGKVDHRLDSRHTAGIRKALRSADLQQYQQVSEDFEEESEEHYRKRILGTVQRTTGLLLVSKEAWTVLSNGELQESVVVKICGEEAEEIADLQAFTIFTSPLPGDRPLQSAKSSFRRPDMPVPLPKPIFQAEEEEPLIAAIEAVLDAPPDSREAFRSRLKSELKAGLKGLKTHYEDQLRALRSEWQNTMGIWAAEKACLISSIEHLEQQSGTLRICKLEERLSQLQQTADKLYDSFPALQEKAPPITLQAVMTSEYIAIGLVNRKLYDINNLKLVIKCEKGELCEIDMNVKGGCQGQIKSQNPVGIDLPMYVALVQRDREVAAPVAVQKEGSGLGEKFQHVRETLREAWNSDLESCLLTLQQDPRAGDWSEADLIDLLFSLQSKDN